MGLNLGLLWILSANAATTVFVPLDSILRSRPEAPEQAPRPFLVDALDATVKPGEETRLSLRWTLTPLQAGWVDLALVGAELAVSGAEINGRPVALAPGSDGMQHLTIYLDSPVTVTVRGSVATPASALSLRALGGVRQRVAVEGPWEISAGDGVRLPGGRVLGGDRERLTLGWRPAGPAAEKPPLLRAEASSAARVDAGGVEVESVLRYRVVRGAFDAVQLRLDAGAEELDVDGDGVSGVSRAGDVVTVRLARPVTDHLELRVRCRRAGGEGALPLPWPVAAEAEGWATLSRADESLIVPSPGAGASAVSNSALPSWARGLVEGAPLVSYRLSGAAPRITAQALRWEPIDGPPTVVDEARYEVASADHGRLLLRARYQVRNDRNQFLRVTVPEGLQLISVTVAGRATQASRDEDGTLLIPLEKSVETLSGLVTFPVDIAFLGEDAPWDRRGVRSALTPAIDAPIAYARWEMVLPPGFSGEVEDTSATEVPDWSSRANGLQYGRAYGDGSLTDGRSDDSEYVLDGVNTADGGRFGRSLNQDLGGLGTVNEEASQQAWNQAYSAYKENRFEDSKALLDQSLALNPGNQAAVQLSGNLDVLLSESIVTGEEEVAARRVKDLARAKTGDAERQQEELQSKADEAIRAGDYEEAEKTLERLVKVSGVLASVEQTETMDKKAALSSSSSQLDMVRRELRGRGSGAGSSGSGSSGYGSGYGSFGGGERADDAPAPAVEAPAAPKPAPAPPPERKPVVLYSQETEIDFGAGGVEGGVSSGWLLDDGQGLVEHFKVKVPAKGEAYIPDSSGVDRDEDLFWQDTDGDAISDESDALEGLGYLEEPDQGVDLGLLPMMDGYATVIVRDAQAADDLENYMVLEPDIAELLFATDVTGFTGEEGLHTEIVMRSMSLSGYGTGGGVSSGYGSGRGASVGRELSASTAAMVVPRAGQILRFEARLVPEGQPLTATLSYRSARKR